jgi:Protein of unknown function (DUF2726)
MFDHATSPALMFAPYLLALICGVCVGFLMRPTDERRSRGGRRASEPGRFGKKGVVRFPDGERFPGPPTTPPRPRVDAADQLRTVMGASFSVQALLNRSEARLFAELDPLVLARNPTWQVMAQVSLGEILRTPDRDAYACINSKRVDLLLVDGDCNPRHAIEYQGTGHHQGTAAARDAVKKEALRRAGIGYHEVIAGETTPSDLRRLVERLVDQAA